MFKPLLYKCIFDFISARANLRFGKPFCHFVTFPPVRGIPLALRYVERNSVFEWISLKFIINTSFPSPFPHQIFNLLGTPMGLCTWMNFFLTFRLKSSILRSVGWQMRQKLLYSKQEVRKMNAKKVGSFIKEQRQELGLSQKELAEKLYITDKAVSKWETGVSHS